MKKGPLILAVTLWLLATTFLAIAAGLHDGPVGALSVLGGSALCALAIMGVIFGEQQSRRP